MFPIGAAGTIYLKGANQTYGSLIVDNGNVYVTGTYDLRALTMISTNVTDTGVGDVTIRNAARLGVDTGASFPVYGSWSNAGRAYSGANLWGQGTVVLAGTTAATVWGLNTWYNLTITNTGKVVSFQTNVIQYIYGTPTFDNHVTLQSTSNSVWWYLLKPGSGTQDVGQVNVWDSNATNGMTFAASGGNNLGHNIKRKCTSTGSRWPAI